jgi:hypothetical protein
MTIAPKFRVAFSAILILCASFVLLNAISGCDKRPTRVPVSGQVLIDGEPLKYGAVIFVPDGGRSSMGTLDQNGHFSLSCFTPNDGALLGKHKVQVIATEQVSEYVSRIHAPKKYGGVETSGITEEITGPTDSLKIELTWKGNPPGKPYTESFTPPAGSDAEPHDFSKKK